jgi:hypothetical protein
VLCAGLAFLHHVPRFAAPSISADAEHKPELVPAAIVVGFVDAHASDEQAKDERDRRDDAVPKPAPESSGLRELLFVLRFRSGDGEWVGHLRGLRLRPFEQVTQPSGGEQERGKREDASADGEFKNEQEKSTEQAEQDHRGILPSSREIPH